MSSKCIGDTVVWVENADDRPEYALTMTRKGEALDEEPVRRLKHWAQQILPCLSAQERNGFAAALGKIEKHLGLVQASRAPSAAEAY